MARSSISLSVLKLAYAALLAFAQIIHDGFVSFVLQYPSPVPTMLIFQGHIDALQAAITAWGIKGNRGSHQAHLDLIAAATVVRNDLRQLALYAMGIKPDNPTSWSAVGFKIKGARSKPKKLEVVQNFHQFISRDIPLNNCRLKWDRPLNTTASEVKGYIIQKSLTPVKPQIDGHAVVNVLAVVTDTSVIDTEPAVGSNYYWVTAFNAAGYGISSDLLLFVCPGAATA